jgi:hypothetical protein
VLPFFALQELFNLWLQQTAPIQSENLIVIFCALLYKEPALPYHPLRLPLWTGSPPLTLG